MLAYTIITLHSFERGGANAIDVRTHILCLIGAHNHEVGPLHGTTCYGITRENQERVCRGLALNPVCDSKVVDMKVKGPIVEREFYSEAFLSKEVMEKICEVRGVVGMYLGMIESEDEKKENARTAC